MGRSNQKLYNIGHRADQFQPKVLKAVDSNLVTQLDIFERDVISMRSKPIQTQQSAAQVTYWAHFLRLNSLLETGKSYCRLHWKKILENWAIASSAFRIILELVNLYLCCGLLYVGYPSIRCRPAELSILMFSICREIVGWHVMPSTDGSIIDLRSHFRIMRGSITTNNRYLPHTLFKK